MNSLGDLWLYPRYRYICTGIIFPLFVQFGCLIAFSSQIEEARTSSILLNRRSKNRLSCLVPGIRRKALSIFTECFFFSFLAWNIVNFVKVFFFYVCWYNHEFSLWKNILINMVYYIDDFHNHIIFVFLE